MNHRIYNLIKTLNRIIFPASGAIYFGLSQIYAMPNESQVIGILVVLAAISGLIVQFAYKKYDPNVLFQGSLVISETMEGKKVFSLELSKTPEEIEHMEAITFKVVDVAE